jgi:dolichol-phosphate mannosyltransferase
LSEAGVRRPAFTRDVVIIGGRGHLDLPLVNTRRRGPANAIRCGINAAAVPAAVVTMADSCDDARQIDDLTRLAEREVVVAAAARYMAGTI